MKDWYTAEENEIRSDSGIITDESQLPVTRLETDVTSDIHMGNYFKVNLGPIRCEQGNKTD